MYMHVLSTTDARKKMSDVVDEVSQKGAPVFLTRNNKLEAILRRPTAEEIETYELMWLAQQEGNFDFLDGEPDLYTVDDLVETYV